MESNNEEGNSNIQMAVTEQLEAKHELLLTPQQNLHRVGKWAKRDNTIQIGSYRESPLHKLQQRGSPETSEDFNETEDKYTANYVMERKEKLEYA